MSSNKQTLQQQEQAQRTLPKNSQEDAARRTPPPAYAPPATSATRLTAEALRCIQAQQGLPVRTISSLTQQRQHPLVARMQSLYAPAVQQHDEPDAEDEEDRSPISLNINTSISVSQSNNFVCLPTQSPSDQANAIARAVVQAIHEHSAAKCGIPMIDENGRPRPIKIEVDAGMRIYGSGNVVGSKDFIKQVFEQQNLRRRAREVSEEEDAEASPAKRRRSHA